LLCLLFAWRRRQSVKRALPVDPVVDHSNEFNSISPNLPNHETVGTPKLLGTEQSSSEQKFKGVTSAAHGHESETAAPFENQADEQAESSAQLSAPVGSAATPVQQASEEGRRHRKQKTKGGLKSVKFTALGHDSETAAPFENQADGEAESSAQLSATAGSAAMPVQQVSERGQRQQKQKTKGGLQCPAGHVLVDCTLPSRGLCDGCGRVLEQGHHAMDCRSCDWILCDACRWQKAMGAVGLGGTRQHKSSIVDSDTQGQLQQRTQSASSTADVEGNGGAETMEPSDLEAAERDEGSFPAVSNSSSSVSAI